MKKLLATLLASTMALSAIGGLVACGGDDNPLGDGTKELKPSQFSQLKHLDDPLLDKANANDNKVAACTLTVWAPAEIIPTFEAMMEDFTSNSYHNGKYANVTVNFEPKEEGNVQDALGTDASVEASADIFFYAGDHTGNMIRNNWLLPLRGATGSYYSAAIAQRDDADAAALVTRDGYAYAFPATNDNGYYLVYDKTKLTEEEADDLDTILAKATEGDNDLKFVWDYGSGYYIPTFFFGAGVVLDQKGPASNFSSFNSDKGQIGAKAMIKYINNTAVIKSTGNGSAVKGIKDGEVIAGFCGTWESPSAADLATVGCKKLPMFTVDGVEGKMQMGSFFGGKYCGINSNTENALVAMAVANYLTNSAAQKKRFEVQQTGPSNKEIAALPEVQANVPLQAYKSQIAAGGVLQGDIAGSYWSGIQTYTDDISKGNVTLTDLGLANLVTLMTPVEE